MALYVYNITGAPVTMAVTGVVVPLSPSPASRGPGVNVTAECRPSLVVDAANGKTGGLTGANYVTIAAQAVATLEFVWTSQPEYLTTGLTPDSTHAGGTADAETATMVASVLSNHVRYEAPIAAELVSIVGAVNMADGVQIIAAQPGVPRKLQVRIVDGDSSVSAGSVALVGVGPSGEAVSESVTLTGGTATKITTKAYATLTSATVSGLVGAVIGDTIGIGVGAALGLPGHKTPLGATFAVYKANVDQVNETVGTVDATAGTVSPTTAANGARHFDFWYTVTVTEVQNSHTHTIS